VFLAFVISLVLIGCGQAQTAEVKTDTKKVVDSSAASNTNVQVVAEPVSDDDSVRVYKDGTYSKIGKYVSPAGDEQVSVKVTLKDSVITEVEFEADSPIPASKRYQGLFKNGYKDFVIGKKIDEVKLDKISGSSLTPKGFNAAIEEIKVEAKA